MRGLPYISKGLGSLTPRYWAKMMNAVSWVENHRRQIDRANAETSQWDRIPPVKCTPAVITGYTVHQTTPLRYLYNWEEMQLGDDTDLLISSGATSDGDHLTLSQTRSFGDATSSNTHGQAYNTTEWGYAAGATYLPPGFDTADPDWPSSTGNDAFVVQPIWPRSMVIMYFMPSEVLDADIKSNLVPCFTLSNIVMGGGCS